MNTLSFDQLLGQRIRVTRRLHGLTQQELAAHLHVSFQQVQKYEHGSNKISFEKLYLLSKIFEVPLHHWVDDASPILTSAAMESDRQTLLLLQCYHAISEGEHKLLVCSIARALAAKEAA